MNPKTVKKTVTTTTYEEEVAPPQQTPKEHLIACMREHGVRETYIQKIVEENGIETVAALAALKDEDLIGVGIPKLLAKMLITTAKDNFPKQVHQERKDVVGVYVGPGAKFEAPPGAVTGVNYGTIDNRKWK